MDNLATIKSCAFFRPTIPDSTCFPETLNNPETTPTPTVSGLSCLDQEPAPKRQRTGKVSNRKKSRPSKRPQTTFITADTENFRHMVQQVTGVRFGDSQVPVVKPEPQRLGNRLAAAVGWLPTLDTSELLLDHHRQQPVVGAGISGPVSVPYVPPVGVGVGLVDSALASVTASATAGLDLGTFSSFPTLDSWKVM